MGLRSPQVMTWGSRDLNATLSGQPDEVGSCPGILVAKHEHLLEGLLTIPAQRQNLQQHLHNGHCRLWDLISMGHSFALAVVVIAR